MVVRDGGSNGEPMVSSEVVDSALGVPILVSSGLSFWAGVENGGVAFSVRGVNAEVPECSGDLDPWAVLVVFVGLLLSGLDKVL